MLGHVHDHLKKPKERIPKTPMFRTGCVAIFFVNLPVLALAIACLFVIVVGGYLLCLPLAVVTFRFRHWPSNLALLWPYMTHAWQRPGWWLFEDNIIIIFGIINRHKRRTGCKESCGCQGSCHAGAPQWVPVWLNYAKIFTLTPLYKYVWVCNPICTKLSLKTNNQITFTEHQEGTQMSDIINSTNGSTHVALFDYENYEALDKVAPTPAVSKALKAGDIRAFSFKPFYPYPSDEDGTKSWRRNYCMGVKWLPVPKPWAPWNLTNVTCNHTPRGDGGFAHCDHLEKAAGFRRLPRTNSRSMTAERAMYLVWLGYLNPGDMYTGYVEVNLQAPSVREKNNGSLGKQKTSVNPDLQPTGRVQYGLEQPMWLIVGDNVLASVAFQGVGGLFFRYGPQIIRLADICREVINQGRAEVFAKNFYKQVRSIRIEWMLRRVGGKKDAVLRNDGAVIIPHRDTPLFPSDLTRGDRTCDKTRRQPAEDVQDQV